MIRLLKTIILFVSGFFVGKIGIGETRLDAERPTPFVVKVSEFE